VLTDGKGVAVGVAMWLSDLCRIETFALHRFPHQVAAKVLPEALQPPNHVELTVGKMFEEAVADEPHDVLPVVITLVSNFFLQDGTDGNHRGSGLCLSLNVDSLHTATCASRAIGSPLPTRIRLSGSFKLSEFFCLQIC